MDTATIAVIVSGVVGVTGVASPLILDRRADARARIERHLARIDDLRDVIDCACDAVARVRMADPSLEPSAVLDLEKWTADIPARLPALTEALLALWQVEHRIGTRVGTADPLRRAVRELHDALGEMHTYLSQIMARVTPSSDPTTILTRQIAALSRFYDERADRVGVSRRQKPAHDAL